MQTGKSTLIILHRCVYLNATCFLSMEKARHQLVECLFLEVSMFTNFLYILYSCKHVETIEIFLTH